MLRSGLGIGALGHCPKESAWRGIQEEFPEIVWDHSHVVLDESGTVRTYCVYDAPNEELVRRAAKLGGTMLSRSTRSWANEHATTSRRFRPAAVAQARP